MVLSGSTAQMNAGTGFPPCAQPLATFEQTQQVHIEDRDRLIKELEEVSRS
jgi:hypothetical protein